MRWKIGDYEVKYNPKSNDKSWGASERITTNINGNTSNPNLIFNGTQSFTIDLFDRPTYSSREYSISGSYIASVEDRYTDKMFLLKSNSTVDVKYKDGSSIKTVSISGTASVVLPTGNPLSITKTDSELIFLYKESDKITIIKTDENGVANRKYIYSNTDGDISKSEHICWDFNDTIYVLNPFGKIYAVSIATGSFVFLYEFGDFTVNNGSSTKKYTSVLMTVKNGYNFIGVLKEKKDVLFLDSQMNVSCKVETKLSNITHLTYSNYSGQYYVILGGKLIRLFPNTCRLDVSIIKSILSEGQTVIRDELGFPSVISVRDLRVARNRNMHEAKYEIQFSADIAYGNQTFDNKWQSPSREV